MSTAPHHDDNNQGQNHGDDERARIENAAAQLRVSVATMRTHRRLWRAGRERSPGSGSIGF